MMTSSPLVSSAGSRIWFVTYATAMRSSGSTMTIEPPQPPQPWALPNSPCPGRIGREYPGRGPSRGTAPPSHAHSPPATAVAVHGPLHRRRSPTAQKRLHPGHTRPWATEPTNYTPARSLPRERARASVTCSPNTATSCMGHRAIIIHQRMADRSSPTMGADLAGCKALQDTAAGPKLPPTRSRSCRRSCGWRSWRGYWSRPGGCCGRRRASGQ
jgi:hypothetical protein